MAMVSYIGHDLRMVEANCNGLMEAFEPDRLGPMAVVVVAACSVRREDGPVSPLFGGPTPFDMSALLFVYPFRRPRTLLSDLEGEGEVSAVPFSLAAVATVAVMAGSLEERDEDRST